MESQQQVWNAIAEEWNSYKEIPSELSKNFLNSCSGKVLDLGSGLGNMLARVAEKGMGYGVEIEEDNIK